MLALRLRCARTSAKRSIVIENEHFVTLVPFWRLAVRDDGASEAPFFRDAEMTSEERDASAKFFSERRRILTIFFNHLFLIPWVPSATLRRRGA